MSRLLTSDTAKRLTAAEALEHPWMTGGASKTPFVKTVMNNLKDFTATSKFKTGTQAIATPKRTAQQHKKQPYTECQWAQARGAALWLFLC